MHPHQSPPRRPQRTEPGHAVPDLDRRRVTRTPANELAQRNPGEHVVAATALDHPVAVSVELAWRVAGGRTVHDLDADVGPAPEDLVGVQLRTAGLGIVEIPPGVALDAPDTGGDADASAAREVGRGPHRSRFSGRVCARPHRVRSAARRTPAAGCPAPTRRCGPAQTVGDGGGDVVGVDGERRLRHPGGHRRADEAGPDHQHPRAGAVQQWPRPGGERVLAGLGRAVDEVRRPGPHAGHARQHDEVSRGPGVRSWRATASPN